jgi:hypothetical protein
LDIQIIELKVLCSKCGRKQYPPAAANNEQQLSLSGTPDYLLELVLQEDNELVKAVACDGLNHRMAQARGRRL